ncbi:iron-sulfur cluster assembly protein [Natronorubrum sp. FCH18a]|uniref:iron-sulfur cluster assembly protein n=1 Tax=Natronorubrum sp. FCH18a TaxID=3447018 RepID=UPI003F50FCFC
MTNKDLIDAVKHEVAKVNDPCTCVEGNPESIVDLGLLESVEINDGKAIIHILPTTPFCLYMTDIMNKVEENVETLDRIESVEVTQETEELWTSDRMADHLQQQDQEMEKKYAKYVSEQSEMDTAAAMENVEIR